MLLLLQSSASPCCKSFSNASSACRQRAGQQKVTTAAVLPYVQWAVDTTRVGSVPPTSSATPPVAACAERLAVPCGLIVWF